MIVLIDPELMGLEELRVNDISTTFTIPKNYIEAITGGAIFVREKHDTPMSEIYTVPLTETAPFSRRSRRQPSICIRKQRRCPGMSFA